MPRTWRTAGSCAPPRVEQVLRLAPRDEPCVGARRDVSSLVVVPAADGLVPLGRRVDLGATPHGVELTTSGLACDRVHRSCRLSFLPLPAGGGRQLVYDVRTAGPRARTVARAVLDSVRRKPVGLSAVPVVDVYGPTGRAGRVLRAAGLEGVDPGVGYPHYVIGTRPSPGTVVPVGSQVLLRVGDG